MNPTLLQVQKQIAALRETEERLKRAEADGVAARIREAIAAYGFTPSDLFVENKTKAEVNSSPTAPTTKSASVAKTKMVRGKANFADANGNSWSGMGPKPRWLREALDNGSSLSEFAVSRAAKKRAKSSDTAPKTAPLSKATKSVLARIRYRLGDNTWTGRGPRPRWLREALFSGKSLDQFSV